MQRTKSQIRPYIREQDELTPVDLVSLLEAYLQVTTCSKGKAVDTPGLKLCLFPLQYKAWRPCHLCSHADLGALCINSPEWLYLIK